MSDIHPRSSHAGRFRCGRSLPHRARSVFFAGGVVASIAGFPAAEQVAAEQVAAAAASANEAPVDFSRDIRPILSDRCFLCHGPDESSRQADLRLDNRQAAIDAGAIDPADWQASEILRRIESTDPDEMMPPPGSKEPLSESQIAAIGSWLRGGAEYEEHWAFAPPQRTELPPPVGGAYAAWDANPVDRFVLRRMLSAGLQPQQPADAATLVRRLHLDLVGLPPSPEVVDCFVAGDFVVGDAADAYEAELDRLMASPHFGERWARWWLDAARYSDSDGYEKDKPRDVWFYRDWVIAAMNADMPYDRFVVEQIAGDLLPNATQDQVVATGFLRNSMVNEEGGADPEQFRVEGMFDRVDAVGKAILGLTTQCAQCHTHKYDPITHEDYYRMFAALNDFHEATVSVFTPRQQELVNRIESQLSLARSQSQLGMPNWKEQLKRWHADAATKLLVWKSLRPTELPYQGQKFRVLEDDSVLSESYAPTKVTVVLPAEVKPGELQGDAITAVRLDVLMHDQLPHGGPGRSIFGTGALSEFECSYSTPDKPDEKTKVIFRAAYSDAAAEPSRLPAVFRNKDAAADDDRTTGPIGFAIDGSEKTAWTTDVGPGRRNRDRHAIFVADAPISVGKGLKLEISLCMRHGGWNADDNQNYLLGRYRLSVTSGEIDPQLASVETAAEPLLRRGFETLSGGDLQIAFDTWAAGRDEFADLNSRVAQLWRQYPAPHSQLAAKALPQPRETFVLARGDFLSPTTRVEPGVLDFLNPMPAGDEPTRLRFARWMVCEDSPTTARVIVNRMWQAYFGRGLVETPEDFGHQSPAPSHPELLDWLAVELVDSGWSLKHVHRLIVTSQAYRQSSWCEPEKLEVDPYNVLLARGPRFRVDAETVRDIALAAGGLLEPAVGGPSVFPPAPMFLFEPPASYGPKIWPTSRAGQQFRRSLYVHSYRSTPYPPLQAFDAPKGEAACVRRTRSNTPLQSLVMLNEPQFLQAAAAMAARAIREAEDDSARVSRIHRLCTGREPCREEYDILLELLEQQRARIAAGEIDAAAVVEGPAAGLDMPMLGPEEFAPWFVVARVVLNLDETITKE